MSRSAGVLGAITALGLVLYFARLNSAERVTVDLGLTTLYRVPMTWVVFGSLLVGMVIMILAGLHADLKVRRVLRDRLRDEDAREREAVDRAQQDLFLPTPPAAAPRPAPPRASGSGAPPRTTAPGPERRSTDAPPTVPSPEPPPSPDPGPDDP